MAITKDDFNKIWGISSSVPEYTFSDSDYADGWEFVGNLPPTRAMWDKLQKRNDQKMQYLVQNATMWVDTVADLRSYDANIGEVVGTKGYYSVNDGGASVYTIRAKDVADVEDGGSIIFLANGNVAELITDGIIDLRQYGAKTNDDISDMFSDAQTHAKTILINDTYTSTKCIHFSCNIEGTGKISVNASDFNGSPTPWILNTYSTGVHVKGISLESDTDPRGYDITDTSTGYIGIRTYGATNIHIDSVKFHNVSSCIYIVGRSKNVLVSNVVGTNCLKFCGTENTTYPETDGTNTSNIRFVNCWGTGTYGYDLGTGNNVVAENCYFKTDHASANTNYRECVVFVHPNDNAMPVHPVYKNCTFEVYESVNQWGCPIGINEILDPSDGVTPISTDVRVTFEDCKFIVPQTVYRAGVFNDLTKVEYIRCLIANGEFAFLSGIRNLAINVPCDVVFKDCKLNNKGTASNIYCTKGNLLIDNCKLSNTDGTFSRAVNIANAGSRLSALSCTITSDRLAEKINEDCPATVINCNGFHVYAGTLDNNYLNQFGNTLV